MCHAFLLDMYIYHNLHSTHMCGTRLACLVKKTIIMGAGRLKGNKRKKRGKGSKKEENILLAGIEPRGFGTTGSYVTDTGHLCVVMNL